MLQKLLVKIDFRIIKNWIQKESLRQNPSLNPVCRIHENFPILAWSNWDLRVPFPSFLSLIELTQLSSAWGRMKPPSPCEWRGSRASPRGITVLATTLPNPRRSRASVGSCTPCFPITISTGTLLCSIWWKASTEIFSVVIVGPKIPVTSLPVFHQPPLSRTIKNVKCCRETWISTFV